MKYFSRLVLIFILSLAFVSCGKKGTAYNRNIMANYSIVAAQEYQISAGHYSNQGFSRHALTLMYPEHCPDVNLYSQSLGSAILDNSWVKDFVKGTKLDLSFGVAGSISFANANPSIDFKIGVLVKVELPDDTGLNGWLYWYIVEFRGGVGIGYTVLGAGADVTESLDGIVF